MVSSSPAKTSKASNTFHFTVHKGTSAHKIQLPWVVVKSNIPTRMFATLPTVSVWAWGLLLHVRACLNYCAHSIHHYHTCGDAFQVSWCQKTCWATHGCHGGAHILHASVDSLEIRPFPQCWYHTYQCRDRFLRCWQRWDKVVTIQTRHWIRWSHNSVLHCTLSWFWLHIGRTVQCSKSTR